MNHLSLFTGIGGLDIAAEMAGIETVGQCEWADYQTKVLERHWPDVPRWRDIRTLSKESFYERTGLRTVDIISGGFPCQPFSVAGERRGEADDRYLWPEMCRVIKELKPRWVVGENVPGIVNLALDTVLADLEGLGYSAQAFIVPACGADAPHRRDRVFILAYSESVRPRRMLRREKDAPGDGEQRPYHGGGAESDERWKLVEDESATLRVAHGLRAEVHGADTDSESFGLQGRSNKPLVFTKYSSRERERAYRAQLDELVELTPLGKIGQTNPTYVEWLMGFPIGWTELNASETP